jgi:ABC-type dipeptide/oligopeptide/nickel transport system permease subunit
MPEVVVCPDCLRRARAHRTLLGRAVKCPHCDTPFTAAARMRPATDARMRDDEDDDRRRRRYEDDDDRPRRRRGRREEDDDDEDDESPPRRARVREGTDTFGILSVSLGAVAGLLIPLGCCCVATVYVAVPVALLGGAFGMWGRGALRVIGLVLNVLALLPAVTLTVLLVVGVSFPGLMGPGKGVNQPRPGVPWNNPPRH